MKGSTLHRSSLTREKMSVLASLTQHETKQATRAQLNQYYKSSKARELDLLWDGVHRGMQKVHSATRSVSSKSPMTYLIAGFIMGVICMGMLTLIVSFCSSIPTKKVEKIENKSNVALIGEDGYAQSNNDSIVMEEKYIVKSGDTLNGIAYRFYGKYSEAKIQEIQRINNITNPAALRVGQELIIPVSEDR